MNKKNHHVVPFFSGWAVKREGNDRVILISQEQKYAIEFARELAMKKRGDIVIHLRNGRIRSRKSYKYSPYSIIAK